MVTGGSAGIGAAIVRALAGEGCRVAFCARDQGRIDAAMRCAESLPGEVRAQALDVTDIGKVKDWYESIGAFDILVPNVSALSGDWEAAFRTDVRGTAAATEAAIPFLQKSRHGAITYIGSKASSLAGAGSYGAAKAAAVYYMKSLSLRLLPGVRVNVVSPGDTLFEGGVWGRMRTEAPEAFQNAVERNPMKRLADPEEIARVVAFVSSPAASFVAGANWYVDGGSVGHVQL
ncbi:MAG: SDR family NAD(P)-dependent oxidoreductase [Planctomycetota bacterium]|nr:SDR family NAD(P)-dependent oxidoreductase [Planctomycetota bacterium]